jgi:hypothetical protein
MKNVMTFESFVFEASEGVKIAKSLMRLDVMAWKKLGIKNGSQLYGDPKLQAEYKNIIWTGLQGREEEIQAHSQDVYDKLEDQNYHALNNLLSLMGLIDMKMKNYYTDAHKMSPNSHLNPQFAS